jgi:hypothetical protein
MKGPGGFQKLVNAFMNILLGICMTFFVLARLQNMPQFAGIPIFTPFAVLQSFVLSFVIGYSTGDLLPVFVWGQKLVELLCIKNRVCSHLILSIILGFCFGVSITFITSFINNIATQGMTGVLAFFFMVSPGIVVMAIVLILIALLPIIKLSSAISGYDPAQVTVSPTFDKPNKEKCKQYEY